MNEYLKTKFWKLVLKCSLLQLLIIICSLFIISKISRNCTYYGIQLKSKYIKKYIILKENII